MAGISRARGRRDGDRCVRKLSRPTSAAWTGGTSGRHFSAAVPGERAKTAKIGGATALVLAASTTAMAASWSGADLTAIAGAPAAAGNPAGYTTDLTGQGPVARVVYKTTSGHIEELSVP